MESIFNIGHDLYSELWQYLGIIVLCISIVAFVVFFWLFIDVVRKYEARKKQLRQELAAPGMKDMRYLFKPLLSQH